MFRKKKKVSNHTNHTEKILAKIIVYFFFGKDDENVETHLTFVVISVLLDNSDFLFILAFTTKKRIKYVSVHFFHPAY